MGERIQQRRQRRMSTLNILVSLLVGVAALSIIAFVSIQLLGIGQEPIVVEPQVPLLIANSPEPVDTLIPTFTPLPLAFGATAPPRATQNYTGSGVLVTIETTQRTWLGVIADGNEQFAARVAPNLTHLGDRTTFAGSIYELDAEKLAAWVRNAPDRKPMSPGKGVGMPAFPNMTDDEVDALVQFLLCDTASDPNDNEARR